MLLVSDELQRVLGNIRPKTPPHALRQVWAYIRKKHLQAGGNVTCDARMKAVFSAARLEPREVLQGLHAHLQVSPERELLSGLRGALGMHVSADHMLPLHAHAHTLAALSHCVLALDVRRAALRASPTPTFIFREIVDVTGATHRDAVAWDRATRELRVRKTLARHFAHAHPIPGSRRAWWVVEPPDYRLLCITW